MLNIDPAYVNLGTTPPRSSAAPAAASQPSAKPVPAQGKKAKRRRPNELALRSNLKKRGLDAVQASLANVYGNDLANEFITETTGFAPSDPRISAAIEKFRATTSNPVTMAPAAQTNRNWRGDAANYEARRRRSATLENADRFPGSADIFLGGAALQPVTRGLDPDNPTDAAYTKKVRPLVKMVGTGDIEFDPFTNEYTPSAKKLQKEAFDAINRKYGIGVPATPYLNEGRKRSTRNVMNTIDDFLKY
jgi:hypothetical protein